MLAYTFNTVQYNAALSSTIAFLSTLPEALLYTITLPHTIALPCSTNSVLMYTIPLLYTIALACTPEEEVPYITTLSIPSMAPMPSSQQSAPGHVDVHITRLSCWDGNS